MKVVIDFALVAFSKIQMIMARERISYGHLHCVNWIGGNGRSGGWTCHPIEHELSAFYDITHGIGLQLLFNPTLDGAYCITHHPSTHEKFAKYGEAVWGLTGDSQAEIARKSSKNHL